MSEIGEAVGTAVEGGLFARAIGRGTAQDGTPRPLEKGHFAETTCLNCANMLTGPHCQECGQKAHLHRTLGAFLHDLLHGALHFEGRTWKTLPMLVFRPGELTRRYIEGERRKFVSPMALFLFSIFLMFAVFQVAGISAPSDWDGRGPDVARVTAEVALASVREELESAPLETASEADREQLQVRIDELEQAIANIDEGENFSFYDMDGKRVHQEVNLTGVDLIDGGIIKKWRANPGLMLYKLQTNFYKFSWLLIPLSIPFVWLLFAWKRSFKAYDHAIFVTYSLSFMTLLILAITLAGLTGVHEVFIFFSSLLIPPIHMYKQLRGTYGLSRFSAIWRLIVLNAFIVIVLMLFLQLLLVIGTF